MNIAIENLPIVFLIIIGIGVAVIVVSVISLAGIHEETQNYYVANEQTEQGGEASQLEELFSYFLEEEEKKNEKFRQMMLSASNNQGPIDQKPVGPRKANQGKESIDQMTFNEIIKRYDQGEDVQSIAKSLKKGIGEVKLIISLYSMR